MDLQKSKDALKNNDELTLYKKTSKFNTRLCIYIRCKY